MSDNIERIAKVLAKADGHDPDVQVIPNYGPLCNVGGKQVLLVPSYWTPTPQPLWTLYVTQAVAVCRDLKDSTETTG